MDDLDHSMHIAECDWTVFYEESEECDLPRPPLARHDSASLSDLEDSGNSSPVCSAGPKGPNAAANGDGVGSSAAGCCLEEKNYSGCEKYTSRPNIQSGATGEGDLATKAEMRLAPSVGAEHLAKDPALKGEDGDVQMEGDVKRDPLPGDRAAVDLNESHAADRAARRGVTGAALGGEKERWFVTVNVSPAPRRPRAVPVRKRQRRKRNLKGKDTCRPGQDGSHEDGLELQIMGEHCEFDPEDVTTENPTRVKDLAEEDPESTHEGILSGASQMPLTPRAEDGWSEELVTPPSPKRSVGEPMTSGESAASDEFEDVVDFSSTHSSDSESFVSAAESLEEQRHSQSSSSPTENPNLLRLSANGGADDDAAQGGHVPSRDTALSPSVTAANSEGHERADATQTFPSAAVDKLAADADTPSETRGPPKRGISPPACGSPSGDRLLSVPDLTVTRCCCEADSPETYAEAAGHERPVYAISAFWDEMERLTINDILQLRAGGSGPPRGTPHVEDLVSLEDTREHSPCDGRLTDVSSTADSDYFTQPDESKPDRWSWDFSTSDAEEEYSSGNPSPEPKSDKGRSASGAGREEETATSNEGNATLVPSGDVARTRPEDEDEDAFASRRLARPRRITKSRSVQNVRALNAERLPAQVLPGDDESSRFLGAEGLLKASGSLLAPIPAPLTDGHYEIVFPEGFQDAFREDETESDFCCVPAYEPGDVSVSPGMDFPLWTFRDEMPFFSLHDEKPIPIFSSSRPTVRELTFSNPPWVFLSADREEDDDHFSPIRVSSRAFVHGSDCGAAAPHGIYVWKSLMRKIRFPDKGGSWRGTSGSWAVPVEKSADPSVSSAPSQLFRELAAQQSVWEAFRTTRREGIFSTLKQSDMCLVCIAFASWVLKSSDPDGADAWKAAVLANVSALSAIQYLRHYVKKKNPS